MYKIEEILNTILCGHVLDELKKIPDESIDLGITSPPYWGLRNYFTFPIIWDNHNGCEHEWVSYIRKGITGGTKSEKVQIKGEINFQIVKDSEQKTCKKCGAWVGELGSEPLFQLYIQHLVDIFDSVRRVLKPGGSLWVNLGDTYAANRGYQITGTKQIEGSQPKFQQPQAKDNGITPKSLCGIPDRFKIAMIDRGWICRNEIIWHKPNAMPKSVKDRFTDDYEKFYFFTKKGNYYFEQQLEPYTSVPNHNPRDKASEKYKDTSLFSEGGRDYYSQGGRNKRCVWSINTRGLRDAHFAVFPEDLIRTPILACSPEGGIVMDIFFGSGTSGKVAKDLGRNYIGIELNPEYIEIAKRRLGVT